MAYTKTVWSTGDTITATLANHWETQYAEAKSEYELGNWTLHPNASNRLNTLESEHNDSNVSVATINHGLQNVTSKRNSSTKVEFYGDSRTNHMGREGGFHKQGKWESNLVIDTSTYNFGTSSGKIDNSAGTSPKGAANNQKTYISGKYVLVGVWIKASSGTPTIRLGLQGKNSDGTFSTTNQYQDFTASTSWEFVYIKFDYTANTDDHWLAFVAVRTYGTADDVVNFDGLRVMEVTSTQFNEIGVSLTTTSDPSIQDVYPFVNSVQHLNGVYLEVPGKNINKPFYQWDNTHSNASILSAYELELNATGTYQTTDIEIPALPNTKYTIAVNVSGTDAYAQLVSVNSDGTTTSHGDTGGSSSYSRLTLTATTTSNCEKLRINLSNHATGTFKWKDIQVEQGGTATSFEAYNPSYVYAKDVKLASDLEGLKKDILSEVSKGNWQVLHHFEKNMVLDGSRSLEHYSDDTGFKTVRLLVTSNGTEDTTTLKKYDGKILERVNAGSARTEGDQQTFILQSSSYYSYITVSDTDTGFLQYEKPRQDDIKAYFYDWQVNGHTLGTDVLDEATGSLAAGATYNLLNTGNMRNIVVEKSSDNATWGAATEGTDYSLSWDGTTMTLKNITAGALYFRVDYNYGYVANSWVSLLDGTTAPSTNTLAYVSANAEPNATEDDFYQLTYELADAVTESVQVEGAARLAEGGNHVSLGEGVIPREIATPEPSSTGANYHINNTNYSGSKLNNKTKKIISIYKNGNPDENWTIRENTYAYGIEEAYISSDLFDTSATYTVSYTVLDKYKFTSNATSADLTYNTNLKTVVDQNVVDIEDNANKISILDNRTQLHYDDQSNPHNVTTSQIGAPDLGTVNSDLNKFFAVNQRIDTRSAVLTYNTDGALTKVEEKDGTTVIKTTSLTYNTDGVLTQVDESVGGNTITTTMNYDTSGALISTTRKVV